MQHWWNRSRARGLVLRLASVIFIPLLTGCLLFSKPMISFRGQGWYRVDPITLLQVLEHGVTDVFEPEAARAIDDSPDSKPVQWSQTDFLRIAEILHQQKLHEAISAWQLSQLWFRVNCEDAGVGPQQGAFDLFQEYARDGAILLIQRSVDIMPRKHQVGWAESEVYPVLSHQPSIQLAKVKVPVEQALRIAETQGGQAAREAVQNQCVIYLTLAASRAKNGWEVTYSGFPTRGNLFEIYVNEQTGRARIVPTPRGQ